MIHNRYNPVGFSKSLLMESKVLQTIKTPEEYVKEINRFLRREEQNGIRFISGG